MLRLFSFLILLLPFCSMGQVTIQAPSEVYAGECAYFTVTTTAKPGNALGMGNSGGYVNLGTNVPALSFDSYQAFTIEFWFRTQSAGVNMFFAKMLHEAPYTGYDIYMAQGKIYAQLIHQWGSDYQMETTVESFNDGQWHHVAWTYAGDTERQNMAIYVDGVLQETVREGSEIRGTIQNPQAPATIGSRGDALRYSGQLDEVRVWKTARTAQQIQQMYQGVVYPHNEPSLVGYWRMDEPLQTTVQRVYDYTTNGQHGMLIGDVSRVVTEVATLIAPPVLSWQPGLALQADGSWLDCPTSVGNHTYTVTATHLDGSIETGSTTLTVKDKSATTLTVSAKQEIYAGECARLTASAKASVGNALSMGQAGGYISLGTNISALNFDSHQPFTIELWFRTAANGFAMLFAKMPNDGYQYRGYNLAMVDGKLYAQIVSHWGVDYLCEVSQQAFNDGQWHHVAWTYTGSKTRQGIGVYVDGIKQTTNPYVVGSSGYTLTGTILNSGVEATIGSRAGGTVPYIGSLDEVRVWNIARSAQQIQANFRNGIEVAQETSLVGYWRMDETAGNTLTDQTQNGYQGTLAGDVTRTVSGVKSLKIPPVYTWEPTLSRQPDGSWSACPTTVGDHVFTVRTVNEQGISESATVKVTVKPPLPGMALRPSENRTMMVSNTILAGNKTTLSSLQGLTVAEMNQQVTYMDGLGREVQDVVTQGSPQGNDIIQPVVYDPYGLAPTSYLPYVDATATDGRFKTDAIDPLSYTNSKQYQFFQNLSGVEADAQPFSHTVLDASPLNTVLEQGTVGKAWNPTAVGGEGRIIKPSYRLNVPSQGTDQARTLRYVPSADGSIFGTIQNMGFYPVNQLLISQTADEEGNKVWQFTNTLGQVVLKRVQLSINDYLDTYMVYDNFGQLRAVIPPKAVEQLDAAIQPPATQWTVTAEILQNLCYTYHYDARKRLTEKQTPGAAPEYLVYNRRDELVLTQDGVLKARNQWAFIKYDRLGRVVLTGVWNSDKSRSTLQAEADALFACYEERTAEATYQHYTNQSYPVFGAGSSEIYSVTYYDDYDFDKNGTADASFDTSLDAQFAASPRPRYQPGTTELTGTLGLMTASKVKVLGKTPEQWLQTVVFYDDDYQAVQVQGDNHLGGRDVVTTAYDYAGRITQTAIRHVNPRDRSRSHLLVRTRAQYDHASRVTAAFQQINNETEERLARLTYNEGGIVIQKTVGNQSLQDMDYTYNIKGWLRKINGTTLGQKAGGRKDLFGMEFTYQSNEENSRYDGNITHIQWRSSSDNVLRGYQYDYDALSRLKNAYYHSERYNENYSVTGMQYDKNGNILALNRYGLQTRSHNQTGTYGLIDQLTYSYRTGSNLLEKVEDSQQPLATTLAGPAGDFYDGNKQTTSPGAEYVYDVNGNLIADRNRGIESIVYNVLDLPEKVIFDAQGQNYVSYVYDSQGNKLQKFLYKDGQLVHWIDYLGGFEYQDDELQYVHTAEGRAIAPEKTKSHKFVYEYQYTDQLGHVRMTFREPEAPRRYTATMEPGLAAQEEALFEKVAETRSADNKCAGYSAKVTPQQVLGPWTMLAVGKGDRIQASTRGYYEHQAANSSGMGLGLFLTNMGGQYPGGAEGQKKYNMLSVGVSYSPVPQRNSGVPKAYLKYIFYDKDEKVQGSNIVFLSGEAYSCQLLNLDFTAPEDGYVQVLVVNESEQNVWFDDLQVVHTPTMISQENHYDPWGLNLVGIEKEGDYNWQFNLSEKQADMQGKGYHYETEWRQYDPQLGRFRGQDVLAGGLPEVNPYQYGMNNPVMMNDPTGEFPIYMLAGAVVGGVVWGTIEKRNGGNFWNGFWKGALVGALVGAGVDGLLGNFSNGWNQANLGFGKKTISWGPKKAQWDTNQLHDPFVRTSDTAPTDPLKNRGVDTRERWFVRKINPKDIDPQPNRIADAPKIKIKIRKPNPIIFGEPITVKTPIRFDKPIIFEGGTDRIYSTPETEETLKELVEKLKKHPEINIEIRGNTGSTSRVRPANAYGSGQPALEYPTEYYGRTVRTRDLMLYRAKSIGRYLTNRGISPNRISYSTGTAYDNPLGRKTTFIVKNTGTK